MKGYQILFLFIVFFGFSLNWSHKLVLDDQYKKNFLKSKNSSIYDIKRNDIPSNRIKYFREELELSKYITSYMVLQRSEPFPFMGKGPVGEMVMLDFERNGVHYLDSTLVNDKGDFKIELQPLEETSKACTATLTIRGYPESKITLNNILIGDIWFVGGQSNMEKKVDHLLEADEIIADSDNYPEIRAFRSQYNHSFQALKELPSSNDSWYICDSESISKTSAVAYIFAKEIYKNTNIPIGLMQAYVGGTELETWLSGDKIINGPALQMVEDRIPTLDKNAPKFYQKYPSVNYNGMVHPLINFPIKGFLFYQGESNVKRATEYKVVLKALIEDYRKKWNSKDLPFYYVQLFNIGITDERNYEDIAVENTWQMLREQQLLLLEDESIDNIGMAVSIDTNEERLNPDAMTRIHPRNKKPIGERLAKIALKEQYGKDLVAYSPILEKFWRLENKLFLKLKNVGGGLKIKDGAFELKGFAVAGSDGKYYKARATIEGSNTIIIYSPEVQKPVNAAYSWSRDPDGNLYNSANLPASPFRTVVKGLGENSN